VRVLLGNVPRSLHPYCLSSIYKIVLFLTESTDRIAIECFVTLMANLGAMGCQIRLKTQRQNLGLDDWESRREGAGYCGKSLVRAFTQHDGFDGPEQDVVIEPLRPVAYVVGVELYFVVVRGVVAS